MCFGYIFPVYPVEWGTTSAVRVQSPAVLQSRLAAPAHAVCGTDPACACGLCVPYGARRRVACRKLIWQFPIVPQPCGILSFQRDDMGPHAPGMALNFGFCGVQVHCVAVPEQAVTAPFFRARARGNIVHVAAWFLHAFTGGDMTL